MWPEDPARVRPMLASIGDVPLASADFAYEPKYDGIRALVAIEPAPGTGRRRSPARVRIWSRLGNEKHTQFPEVTAALGEAFAGLRTPLLVDGEIVAVDAAGLPTTFLDLQSRIHVREPSHGEPATKVAFVAFDLLMEGTKDFRSRSLQERRALLERAFADRTGDAVRISEQAVGDGRALQARAHDAGWEGLIAKRIDSRYVSGKRTPDWCKLKLVRQQTCVIGGWTAPKGTRHRFGALLLGVHDDQGRLVHAGQVGTGFSGAELDRVWKRLQPVRSSTSPFINLPRPLQRSNWVRPTLVCEVKFTEWTHDGKLRHPTYLGMRDDVIAESVTREPQSGGLPRVSAASLTTRLQKPSAAVPRESKRRSADSPAPSRVRRSATSARAERETSQAADQIDGAALLSQIDAIESAGGNGALMLPGGGRLEVTNLRKVFWPALKLTKGDLFRHYARAAAVILPALAGRPLVMKRYPNGVDAKPFFQHRAADHLPPGVEMTMVEAGDGSRPHIVGGSLAALLYSSQLAAISQDPWFSRLPALDAMDAIAIDLDPPEGLPFRRVLDVALRVRDELAALGADGFAKTSGSRGVHVFVPMPHGTPFQAGLLYAQIVATMVARKFPRHATVERSIAARGPRVYVDYMQNMRGKTLASVYSARANAWAGVSAPLSWTEVEAGLSPQDITIRTFPDRLNSAGDLWGALRQAKPADLRAVMKYAEP
jgi:bifunctional non-homologous end joining protein LigD